MGGNALATVNVKSKRLKKEDFDTLTKKVIKVLNIAIKKANEMGANIQDAPHEVKAYRQKETFGDLDLLVDGELFNFISYDEILTMLGEEFNHPEALPHKHKDKNDMVFSLGLPSDEKDIYFQLDLIASQKKHYNFHSSYLNWNDLGNLVGVVASSNGFLKYGHDGLVYQLRDGDNLFEQIVLSTDWNEALDFFGYSKEEYYAGFDSLLDIYEYAASSRFFTPSLYAFENRNHTQRTRDRKRPTYNGFLNWIEENNKKGKFESKTPLNKAEWRKRVDEFFPWLNKAEEEAWNRYYRNKEFKKYFNGSALLKYKPELQNVEISNYLKSLRSVVDDLESFVVLHKDQAMLMLVERKEAE